MRDATDIAKHVAAQMALARREEREFFHFLANKPEAHLAPLFEQEDKLYDLFDRMMATDNPEAAARIFNEILAHQDRIRVEKTRHEFSHLGSLQDSVARAILAREPMTREKLEAGARETQLAAAEARELPGPGAI